MLSEVDVGYFSAKERHRPHTQHDLIGGMGEVWTAEPHSAAEASGRVDRGRPDVGLAVSRTQVEAERVRSMRALHESI